MVILHAFNISLKKLNSQILSFRNDKNTQLCSQRYFNSSFFSLFNWYRTLVVCKWAVYTAETWGIPFLLADHIWVPETFFLSYVKKNWELWSILVRHMDVCTLWSSSRKKVSSRSFCTGLPQCIHDWANMYNTQVRHWLYHFLCSFKTAQIGCSIVMDKSINYPTFL